jgi:ATP-dependent protease ClpP protease subunit
MATNDEHAAFWRQLPDHEFFGPRVQHVYFYASVQDESVKKLREEVLAACRSERNAEGTWVDPKPIVIHVNSSGGSMRSEQWLFSLFNQVNVPLCVIVDGMSASASTSLSVMAPYRVGTAHSLSLLHDYSAANPMATREARLVELQSIERLRAMYKRLYLTRTRITEPQLESMLRRDIFLDAPTCLRMGVYDRVVRPDRSASVERYAASATFLPDAHNLLAKTNWNRVFATCAAEFPQSFDAILASDEQVKPILYVTPGGAECADPNMSLAMIARILSSPVPVFGIVDNEVTWWQLLPVLFCHRRFMYENASLNSSMVYDGVWGSRIKDIVHNAGVMRALITDAVRARAKPTPKLLADLFDRTMSLSAQECKANGLVDAVILLSAAAPSAASPATPSSPAPSPAARRRGARKKAAR